MALKPTLELIFESGFYPSSSGAPAGRSHPAV
jgi:hypothetical protein